MTDIFMAVLNMSLTAGFIIAALYVARFVLKRINAPKWISYALWAVAGFRLAIPFAFESALSLLPIKAVPIPVNLASMEHTDVISSVDSGIAIVDGAIEKALTFARTSVSVRPYQAMTEAISYLWLIGVAAMLLYAVISYVRLIRNKDSAGTPFVYGFIKPKIHIPQGLTGEELRYVTLHEQTHIKRRDHLVKLLAFALLCVHWFNPLAWVAFVLMCADMEMSCDERVLRELGMDAKADYSATLLSLSANRRILNASPLAFGEGGLKERVKNVLNFKKRSRIIIIAAVALVAVLSVGFAVNRAESGATTRDLRDFSVYGFTLGQPINETLLESLTPLENYASDEYDYNFKGASVVSYSLDSDTGVVRKLYYDVREQGYSTSWLSSTRWITVDQVISYYGNGNQGWFDRINGIRYVEYTQKEGRLSAKVRFIFNDVSRSLIYVTAESSLPYPMPFAVTSAPPYDPNFVFQTKFEVDPQPDNYMLTMSSVPGIMLGYNGQSDVPAIMQYTSESGSFGLLEDNIITTLGSYVEQDFAASPLVHWTPNADTKDGDKVIMRLVGDGGDLAAVSLIVHTDGMRYSLTQDLTVDSSPPMATTTPAETAIKKLITSAKIENGNLVFTFPADYPREMWGYEFRYLGYKPGDPEVDLAIDPATDTQIGIDIETAGGLELRLTLPDTPERIVDLLELCDKLIVASTLLAELPDDYGTYENREQAITDGVYVNVQGQDIYNQTVVDIFYENALAGIPAFMRVIHYTIEDDPIISDYQYSCEVFTITTDSSRDKFGDYGNKNFYTRTYKYLIKLGDEWTLSQVPADEVAGLEMGWIPAPSDSAAIPVPAPQATFSAADIESAKQAALAHYNGTAFAGKVADLRVIEVTGDYLTDKAKDKNICFSVDLTDDPKSHPIRLITLTREIGGEWEVINEGY
jgi:beta-lactamase regulating signal transducer with metallopeptidase domain